MQSSLNSLEIQQLRKDLDAVAKHVGLKLKKPKDELRNVEYLTSNGKEYEICGKQSL